MRSLHPHPGESPARSRRRFAAPIAVLTALLVGGACGSDGAGVPAALTAPTIAAADTGTPVRTVEVVRTIPHRPGAWTQGLVWDEGQMYESTGLVGQSTVAIIDPATGESRTVVQVPGDLYAEGLAVVDDTLVQLTWQDGLAPIYQRETFERIGEHIYDGEGWGLCYDEERLVMSDGSAELTFRDPTTFEPTGEVTVRLDGTPVAQLNELECVGDRVYANVWHTDTILEIDPDSGDVTTVVDASALTDLLDPLPTAEEAVLNGIAYDPEADTFWLTGKLWPQLFEVRLQ